MTSHATAVLVPSAAAFRQLVRRTASQPHVPTFDGSPPSEASTTNAASANGHSTLHGPRPRKIVVVVDGSEEARAAVEYYLDNVFDSTRDVVLLLSVCAVETALGDVYSVVTRPVSIFDAERADAKKDQIEQSSQLVLDDADRIVRHYIDQHHHPQPRLERHSLLTSDPRNAVINFCRSQRADLLVVSGVESTPAREESYFALSSSGTSASVATPRVSKSALSLSPMSEFCLHNASCPIVIVKGKHGKK